MAPSTLLGMEAIAANTRRLSSLDVSGCIALSRLLLPDAPVLERVALDGCAVLRVVSLVAPQLRELRAKGCVRLMELRLFSAVLRRLNLENCSNLREANVLDMPPAIGGVTVNATGSAARAAAERDEDEPGRVLVLRGCAVLPDATRQRLRVAVLRET